jgi:hypothetical protein
MTKVYLKLVDKVTTKVTHTWHRRLFSTNDSFPDIMETAREFEKTKEDRKSREEKASSIIWAISA